MKKTDIKLMAIVAGGVFVAGLAMNQFRNIAVVNQARAGYGN